MLRLSKIINLTLSVNDPIGTIFQRSTIKFNRHILFVLTLIRKNVFEILDRGEIVSLRLKESPRKNAVLKSIVRVYFSMKINP